MLDTLNRVLSHEHQGAYPRFCTVICGLLVPHSSGWAITLASGGHPPAVLIPAGGNPEFCVTPGGQLVGALPHARFSSIRVCLSAGDTLLLYSDGLTEARTHDRVRYSEGELLDFLRTVSPGSATEVVTAVTGLLTRFGDGVDDDTALLALSIPSP